MMSTWKGERQLYFNLLNEKGITNTNILFWIRISYQCFKGALLWLSMYWHWAQKNYCIFTMFLCSVWFLWTFCKVASFCVFEKMMQEKRAAIRCNNNFRLFEIKLMIKICKCLIVTYWVPKARVVGLGCI